MLTKAYKRAAEEASAETGLAADQFAAECPWSLDEILSVEVE
jgi:hypothetical protein